MGSTVDSEERFHLLFARHHHEIQAYCARRLPLQDANEAAADVFAVAWRRIDEVPDGDESLPWLYGVARNIVRNHKRGAVRRLRLVAKAGSMVDPPVDSPETIALRQEDVVEVTAALAAMRDDDQELLRLKTWEQLANKDIAAILGISVQAVESRYARAMRRLAKRLKPSQDLGTSPLSRNQGDEAV